MHTPWTPPLRWVFGAATLLGCFSTLQAYRLMELSRGDTDIRIGSLLFMNLMFWYIPAAFCPIIFALVRTFPIDTERWRAVAVHAVVALLLPVIHALGMITARGSLWGPPSFGWMNAFQRTYLTNLDWLLMTYTTVVGATYALAYYREVQARSVREAQLQASLMEARLKTLEAELHPHFLFNTLHAISTLIYSKPDAADRMISRLSDLLRLTFDRSGAARVTLQEELEFLQKYLEIEQIRFQDRLTLRYEVDPAVLDAEVPRLILQPLVENAIKHGVSPRTGPGTVQVSAGAEDDSLWLEVRDNGVGLSGNARAQFSRGVGLSNTRERLECLYGAAGRIELSEADAGLAVRLVFPLRHCEVAEPAVRVA